MNLTGTGTGTGTETGTGTGTGTGTSPALPCPALLCQHNPANHPTSHPYIHLLTQLLTPSSQPLRLPSEGYLKPHMRAVTLAFVCAAALAAAVIASAELNPSVSASLDMSSAREFEEEFFYGIVQREDPQLASEVEKLGDAWCSGCTTVASSVLKKGCSTACKVLPNPLASAVCSWIVGKANLCKKILDWLTKGDSTQSVCKKIGFCNSACQCGVCTPAIAGPDGRCLGAIRSCNHPYTKLTLSDMFALSEEARDFNSLASKEQLAEDPESVGFCLRGRCDGPSNYGCCLTCL